MTPLINVIGSSASLAGQGMPPPETRRQSILAAMVRVVGAKGYREASVAAIIEQAGISRTTFYRHFDDKHACFLAAYEMLTGELVAEVLAGCDSEEPWLERMTAGLRAIVGRFAADPDLARILVVEVGAAGADTRRLHWGAVGRFAEYLDEGRELSGGRELPEDTALMSAGAVSGLISDELLRGGAERLPARFPELLFALLVPYIGPEAAAAEMRRAGDAH
jgi:AcrR family transcriptional regulator